MSWSKTCASLLITMAAGVLGAGACTSESVSPPDQKPMIAEDGISVDENGVLHFASPETFFSAIGELSKMTPSALDAWEDERGFFSYRREFEQVMHQVTSASNPMLAEVILRENADLVEVNGDSAEPKIKAFGYSALTTRDGYFYVEGVLHKVTPDLVISSEDGRRETVERVFSSVRLQPSYLMKQMTTPEDGVRVVRYERQKQEPAMASSLECTNRRSAHYQTSNRKVDVEVYVWNYYCTGCCGNFYNQFFVDGKLRGYKKGTFGGWSNSYSTSYNYEQFEFQVLAPSVTGFAVGDNGQQVSVFTNTSHVITPGSGSSPGDWVTWHFGSWAVGDQVLNTYLHEPYFEKIKIRAKSRGTGENGWASFCCGYSPACGF